MLDESAVTLLGTASDSDSTDPTYSWTQNSGSPAVTLAGSDTLTPTFTAPDVSSDVDLIFTLTVSYGTDTFTDTVTVTVHDAEADFVTTWSDITAGTNFPIRNSTGSFTVDWGDGEITEYATITTDNNLRHNYDTSGTYTIRISGNFSGIYLQDNTTTAGKLQSIDQWGDIKWTTMAGAFYRAGNMIYNATDVPDLSSVTDMSNMFTNTGFSSDDLSGWNVSGVTDMRNMFLSSGYTGDLSDWDVSSVTDMQNMFSRTSSFDSDLSGWNVSAVTDMSGMFSRASSFDSDLSGWNVSSVTSMQNMFLYATSFNSDLSDWNVSSVTDMRTMFTGATSFNSDLSGWDVSAVLRMDDMFDGASDFEQNLGPWYIVLDSDTISYPTQTLEIMAQNLFLGRQNPVYGLGVGGDFDLFVVDADAGTLGLNPNSDPTPPPNGIYQVNVTSMGSFGTANHRTVEVTVDNADPAVMPPTFYSSVFNNVTGVLTIVFSETIDAANVVPAKIHIRESGNYTDGITLSAGEFVTVANDTAISFILIASHLTTVTGLTTPELTIEPGAVQDTSGNLIDGTFDVSTAVFVNATSVLSQDNKPYGIAFSNNGTKMFVVGDDHNNINQYTLSTPFDISNASYDGNDERFTALQDTSPRGMAFSDDGTKMFVVGYTNKNINQYALSSPFDVSTASFTTATSVLSQDRFPRGMAFSDDGLKMFVVGSSNDAINQYTLSAAFDLSIVNPVTLSFNVTQDKFPKDMAFSNNGTKMFVIGSDKGAINQYTLSTPFNLVNAIYDGDDERFSVSLQDDDPAGMAFSNDGAKMFVVGDFGNDVNEYALSSVYPITVTDTANQAPSADAGNARQVDEGGSIILQGSGSDPDGNDSDLTYSWSQSPASPVISFDNQNSATPEITAPSVVAETEITLTLRVDDGTDYATDTMVLTIQDVPPVNQAPSADAGNARQVDEGGSIILQGSGSDPDGNDSDLTYSWSQSPASPVISFDNQNSATPEITAPSVVAETEITLTLRVDDGTDYATDTMVLTIQDVPPVNQAPSADAGNARQVDEGGSIILQGSGSDPDGNDSDLTYSWSQSPASPVISFDNQNSATPEITAPSVVAETEITLTLRVDDGTDYATDTMVLTIQDVPPVNQAPSADAGNARQVDEGGSIILQGSGSDPDGNDSDLTYSWSQSPASPVISFDNQNSATPEITAPSVVAETEITLTLRVDDGTDYATDTMVLTIQDVPPVNQAPSADAGNARQVDEGGSIILQGSGSDPDGNDSDLTYSWSQSPASPVISFDNQNSATPEITAPSVVAETEITLTLRVDDGTDYATDTMVLTIQDVPPVNQAPSADAGNARQVDEGGSIILQGSGSDPDGNDSDLTYSWSQSPASPVISFDNQNSATPEITAPSVVAETEITLTLRVDDGTDYATDTMVLTIQDVPPVNQAPSADAGNARQVDEGGSIILQGSGSDPDGNDSDLTYSWSQSPASPVISFDNQNSATPEITAPSVVAETEITLTLRVDDGTDYATDTMVLTIQDVPPVNQAPSADAGNARQVDEGGSIILQGSGSDPDGNDSDLTYSWSQSPASPVISFDNQNSATPEITAPSVVAETEITLTLRVDDGTDYATDTMVLTIQDVPPVNQAPSADAGNARQVDEGKSITLDGSGSDPDGNDSDLTYSWSQSPASPVISFDNQNSATPEITAPSVVAETEITLTLRVDDGTDYATDTMVLTIQDVPPVNQAPSADAGNARQVDEGKSITLDGSGSDPDGNDSDLTYSWSQSPASPVISFDNQNSATPEITAPSVVAETEITLTLRVDDGTDYATDTMVLTIQDVPPVNQAPSADAGNARQVDEGKSITLDGSGSDPDGNDSDLTYSWSQSPASPVISFDNQNSATPEITAPSVVAETEITLTLRVDDGTDYATDTMVLTIQDVPPVNQAPSADAGNARQVDEGKSITLDGSGSDPDGNDSDLTYSWSQSPASPVISFDNQNSATPEITAPSVVAETEITLTLRVDDGTDYATDTMVLTIQDVPPVNQAPSADAGNARQVDEGKSITLDGSGSDPDGNDSDLTYSWSQSPASPVISFDNQNSATPEITAPSVVAETEITLTLRVDDGTDYATDTMVLTIQDVPPVNQAPSADAGNARQVDEGGSIILQGSGSDPDGNDSDLTYSWSQSPASPVISFDNQNSATPEITAPSVVAETEITLTLRVDDGTDYATDTMVLTIQDVTTDNIRPAVNVGPNQTVKEGEQVSMPWTASDPDGDALTYLWSQSPRQPAIFLESPGQSPTTFTTPQVDDDTEFTFTLTVTAGPHNADDSLTITVKNNHSPTVDAGNNRTVNEGVPVTLSGIARDLDDDPLTYEWTIVSGPAPTDLTGDNMESLQFTAPGVAPDEDIVFRFTATDDSGEFAEDTVTITVRDVPITVSSATYNPGSGTLLITFNQDIATVDYSRLHVRSANSDIGGITLFNAVSKDISSNDRTITVVLDSDMREMYTDLTSPHLVVEDGAITDIDGDQTTDVPNQPLRDASSNKRSSSPPPVVHLSALAQARIVDIPAHIAEQISSRDDSDPLEPLMLDDTFDFPLVINNYGYLLDDVTNTLVPQIVTVGDDDPTVITFTVYTQKDLAHFTLYLNLSDENTDYTDSDTYITYKNDGTAVVTDPHGYIADATITVTQEDDSMPEKKTVSITLYFDEPMGPTNMVAYMWNTDRKATFIKIIDAFEVTAVLPESVIQTVDPEPLEPNSELPADPEPSSELPADPEPVSTDTLGPDDYDDAQVLHIIRMWSGFESEFITDEQMLASLGLDYPDADIPDWVMTQLGVLVAKGDVTVEEFVLALQYVLENL